MTQVIFFFSYSTATDSKISWAVRLFEKWRDARNAAEVETPICPAIEDMDSEQLNYSLSRFINESRKQNGEEYPSKSLREMVIGIQLHLEKKGKILRLLMDPRFLHLQNTLEWTKKEREKQGEFIHE